MRVIDELSSLSSKFTLLYLLKVKVTVKSSGPPTTTTTTTQTQLTIGEYDIGNDVT